MANWLIDIDGTTMDNHGKLLRLIHEKFGVDYTEQFLASPEWSWESYMPADVCKFAWDDTFFKETSFHEDCPPIDLAIGTLHHLKRRGEKLFFVSDRPMNLWDVTKDWLEGHGFTHETLIFTDRKVYTKYMAAQDYGLEYVVEDAPHHGQVFSHQEDIEVVFLLDRPYNRQVNENERLVRVFSWLDIPEYLEEAA